MPHPSLKRARSAGALLFMPPGEAQVWVGLNAYSNDGSHSALPDLSRYLFYQDFR
jgi:hypothetical protein